ncbi:Vacuolar import and degradation protein 27 [Coemansia sp. RSA 1286]|nr:Vacuolar import and degradation protein 27 [Coemansia sp. RSA 1286]
MNALKSLGRLVWGSQPDPESARLSSGVFYHTNPGAKVARKCLYKDSELSICRTDIKYQFLLIVQQVFADGEEELEDSDDLDNEHEFLIADELHFTAHVADGFKGFRWVDPDDPSGRAMYEFIIEDSKSDSKLVRDCFARAVAHCVWERKNERPYTQASEAEINAIVSRVEEEELEKMLNSVSISDTELQAALADAEPPTAASPDKADDASSAAEKRKIKSPVTRKEKHKKANKYDKDLPPSPDKIAFGDITVSVIGALYLFDSATESFVEIDSSVALSVIETGKFTYYINVIANDRDYVSQLVEPSMNAIFNHDHLSLIWNYFTDSRAYSFSLAASDESHYNALHQGMTKAAYETLNKVPWSKVSVSSQDYLLDAHEEDLEMAPVPETWSPASEYTDNESDDESDAGHTDQSFRKAPLPAGVKTGKPEKEEDSDEESCDAGESDSESESDEDEDDEYDDDDDDDESVSSGDGAKNSILEIGRKHGRSFVVRGSHIGVFKHTDSDDIQFATNINNIDDTHGNRFTPSSTMLHEGDSSMVLMNQDRPNDLFKMDLEYGKVVEEWKVHEDIPTVSIAPTTKYSQMTGEKTLVGLSHNMLYRIDPRIGGKNMIVEKDTQMYAGKNKFSALATTMTGAIVIGNAKGEIRMYDRLGVRSKTTLPALGDPIIGIDVTSDGRYIVATCSTYLLLIDALIPDDPTGSTGFVKPFPQDKKPAPRRLQLKPEHVVYMGGPPSFTPAKFNQSPSGKASERTIVTSTGPFVVTWNLRRALGTGRGDAYHIKQYSQHVVADNFRFGHDRSIVVALPDDVKSVKRSQLARPTRESLMIRDLSAASSDAA